MLLYHTEFSELNIPYDTVVVVDLANLESKHWQNRMKGVLFIMEIERKYLIATLPEQLEIYPCRILEYKSCRTHPA